MTVFRFNNGLATENKTRLSAKTSAPLMDGKEESCFFATGCLQADGTVTELGGQGRTWTSRKAFLAERRGKAATLIETFPCELY